MAHLVVAALQDADAVAQVVARIAEDRRFAAAALASPSAHRRGRTHRVFSSPNQMAGHIAAGRPDQPPEEAVVPMNLGLDFNTFLLWEDDLL